MTLLFEAVDGIGEVPPGADIAALVCGLATLQNGDVVVVTSKIVSKAAGLTTTLAKDELLARQTDRLVAQRGPTSIVRTHHGLTMAAAGIDNSNTAPGTLIPLPQDPDASASAIRLRVRELTGVELAVIISDTAGRAWRVGQTDIAIGCSGLWPVDSYAGRTDPYGNPLAVTAPAVADQLAGGAELASGKFGGRPVVVVRGVNPAWLTHDDGPGATALIRDESSDMFGLGAREAAVAAILGDGPVRGLPLATDITTEQLVDLALTGLPLASSEIEVRGDEVSVGHVGRHRLEAGIFVQRLRSLSVAYGMRTEVHVAALHA